MRLVTVGILTPSVENLAAFRENLNHTGLVAVAVEASDYCRTRADSNARRFLDVQPDLILIDAEDVAAALVSTQVLHTAIPSAWILVCTSAVDTDTLMKFVRAGARELISIPVTQEAVSEALQRHVDERDCEQRIDDSHANGKIYTICSAKPGSGATTMAINLAASLAEDDASRVALVDLDWPLGDAAAFLNIQPRFTVADALASVTRLDSVLLESYMHRHDRIHVLAGLEDFSAADGFDTAAVAQLFEVARTTYTHTVVDLPATAPRELLQVATSASSAIVTVLTPDVLSLRRTERLLRVLGSFEVSDKVRLVLNRFHKSDDITDGDIQNALHQPVASKVANDYYACIEAINAGKAVLATSNKNLARNYRELAGDLMGQTRTKERKGLSRLLSKPVLSIS